MAKKRVRTFDKNVLENRFDSLQKFLASVVVHPLLRRSPALLTFLKYAEHDQFMAFRAEIDANPAPFAFITSNFVLPNFKDFKASQMRSITGEARSKVSEGLHKYSAAADAMIREANGVYTRLKTLTVELQDNLEKLASTYYNISGEMGALEGIYSRFNKTVEEGKWESSERLAKSLKTSFEELGAQFRTNIPVVKEHLLKTFKFSRKECDAALEIIRVRNVAAQGYFGTLKTLNDAKDKLLNSGDPSKWDMDPAASSIPPQQLIKNPTLVKYLMLSSQRPALKEMRDTFGILNEQMMREIENLGNSQTVRTAKSIGNWANEEVEVSAGQGRSATRLKEAMATILTGPSLP